VYNCCRVRISLGLKPLSTENESDKQRKAQQEREAQKAEEDKAAKAAALAEHVNAYGSSLASSGLAFLLSKINCCISHNPRSATITQL